MLQVEGHTRERKGEKLILKPTPTRVTSKHTQKNEDTTKMSTAVSSSIDIRPYEVLGLAPPSSPDEPFAMGPVSKAYRRLSLIYHPDKNSSPEAEGKFADVQQAYLLLSDDVKRAEYHAKVLFKERAHADRLAQHQQAALDATARLAKRQSDAAEAERARAAALFEAQRQRAAASSGLGSILHNSAKVFEEEILARWEVDSIDVLEAKETEVMARIARLERGHAKRERA